VLFFPHFHATSLKRIPQQGRKVTHQSRCIQLYSFVAQKARDLRQKFLSSHFWTVPCRFALLPQFTGKPRHVQPFRILMKT
jgi:hypothetical protein